MSQSSTPDERTEMPTSRRMNQLRRSGTLPMSQDVAVVVSMTTAFFFLWLLWGRFISNIKQVIVGAFSLIKVTDPLTVKDLHRGFIGIIIRIGPELLLLFVLVATAATLAVMLQTDWNVKEHKIKFDFNKLNPISGLTRIFSINGFVNTGKAILKLCVILPIAYKALKHFAPEMIGLIHTSTEYLMTYAGIVMVHLFWKIMELLFAMAIFDYFWTKRQWLRQNKMTKEEVKDERKAVEGDEQTKRRIRRKGLQRIAQRIRQSVPQADVIITNPTHYAIALKYERDKMSAPMILAKGKGFLALKIREIARENKVPIVERKPLARALYASGEVGKAIPYELYRAVAEVIAYVYKLKNPWANTKQQAKG